MARSSTMPHLTFACTRCTRRVPSAEIRVAAVTLAEGTARLVVCAECFAEVVPRGAPIDLLGAG